jgi:hypothetical protein|tara:strand:+ start:638 stop:838 length:201 start_codon:yes stop_codon:yes gene_type:complete
MIAIDKTEKEAQRALSRKDRVKIVVMVDRENQELLYRLGNGRITKGMDAVFETLKLYQAKEKRGKK